MSSSGYCIRVDLNIRLLKQKAFERTKEYFFGKLEKLCKNKKIVVRTINGFEYDDKKNTLYFFVTQKNSLHLSCCSEEEINDFKLDWLEKSYLLFRMVQD